MNFFLKILGKVKKATNETPRSLSKENKKLLDKTSNTSNTPELFKIELYDSLSRYYSSPNLDVQLELTNENNETFQEYEAFDHTYNEWKEVRSVWDRRSILLDFWDNTEFDKLEKWQIVERFVKDRYGLKAIQYQKTNITSEDFQDIRLVIALSKLYRIMISYETALHYVKAAFESRPDLDIVKVEYATILHLSDNNDDKTLSHNLMNEVLENKIKSTDAKEIALLNYFIFSEDYIDSSVFAVLYLKSGKGDIKTWEKLAEEYYWCPHF